MKRKKCTKCGKSRVASKFYTYPDGRTLSRCVDCERERKAGYNGGKFRGKPITYKVP